MRGVGSFRRWLRYAVAMPVAATLALALIVAFAGSSATAHGLARATAAKPTVKIGDTLVGPLLVNSSSRTLYMFTRDKRKKDVCRTIKGCEHDWPAVTTAGAPIAGPGLKKSLLGTIPYEGKLREVTYNGYPLHTYRFDTGPLSVMNIGNDQFNGDWYALNAKGRLVK
jgi:predicted lipoprotein with Yx(FWY)xxD motif